LNTDPEEARLEARELSRYLLAKSYFDCREFDRCAAVFLPDSVSAGSASAQAAAAAPSPLATTTTTTAAASATSSSHRPAGAKGKARARGSFASVAATAAAAPSSSSSSASAAAHKLPRLSQKALFLSLYAKFLAGEKRKDEESEMILGPADGGATVNRELVDLAQKLDAWCTERMAHDEEAGARSQGWLEFLYVLLHTRRCILPPPPFLLGNPSGACT
jgi:anaphase-promoting complex subunit 8